MRRQIKYAVGGFFIGMIITFVVIFYHESRSEFATAPALILMGLMWSGMAAAVVDQYSRPIRGAILGFCMWAVLTFWLMPGPEPSNIVALLFTPGSDPDSVMTLVGKGAMWVVAGALIGKTWERTGFFTSPYKHEYNSKGLSATAMAAKGAAEGAVIGFAMGAFISGLWDIGMVVSDSPSDVVSALMIVGLVSIGAVIGAIAGLSKWKKRALAGMVVMLVSWICAVELVFPVSLFEEFIVIPDLVITFFVGNLDSVMYMIEDNSERLLAEIVSMLFLYGTVASFGAMLGVIRGVDQAAPRVLGGTTIILIIILAIAQYEPQPDKAVFYWLIVFQIVIMGLSAIGGSAALVEDLGAGFNRYFGPQPPRRRHP